MKESNRSVISGLTWSFAERIASQLVSTVVGILLARLLTPEDYGIIAIVMIFISFCNVFVTAGFSSAVVQKKDADAVDFNTAFILSFSVAVALYIILFLFAPYIAEGFQMPQLCAVLRVIGIQLLITAWNSIQQSYIRRYMQFHTLFKVTILGTVASGVIGIVMAYGGWGIWALVAQHLINSGVGTVLMHFTGEWRPGLRFSWQKGKEIYSFGWKVLCTQLVFTLQNDFRSLVIGKMFGSADLAYYEQGNKYPALLMNNINSAIAKVMLPTFSRQQDDLKLLKTMLRKSVCVGMLFVAPILLGLYAVADTFVLAVLTEKWAQVIPYIKIFCVLYLTRPLEELAHQALISLGRSDIALRIMICIHTTAFVSVLVAVFILKSVYALVLLTIPQTVVSILCFSFAIKRVVGYQLREQLSDVLPSIGIAAVMAVIVSNMKLGIMNGILLLIVQVLTGAAVYLVMNCLCKTKALMYVLGMFAKKWKDKKQVALTNDKET